MGYTLRIGELVVEYSNAADSPYITLSAAPAAHDTAPAFNEPTDRQNQRWPAYSVWSDFAHDVGLHCLFFGKSRGAEYLERDDALLTRHPGCAPITEAHRVEVNDALEAWKSRYPKAVPTYGKPVPDGEVFGFWSDPDNPKENSTMCRLVWLHYWINWAVDNCEQPVFENG